MSVDLHSHLMTHASASGILLDLLPIDLAQLGKILFSALLTAFEAMLRRRLGGSIQHPPDATAA